MLRSDTRRVVAFAFVAAVSSCWSRRILCDANKSDHCNTECLEFQQKECLLLLLSLLSAQIADCLLYFVAEDSNADETVCPMVEYVSC